MEVTDRDKEVAFAIYEQWHKASTEPHPSELLVAYKAEVEAPLLARIAEKDEEIERLRSSAKELCYQVEKHCHWSFEYDRTDTVNAAIVKCRAEGE